MLLHFWSQLNVSRLTSNSGESQVRVKLPDYLSSPEGQKACLGWEW